MKIAHFPSTFLPAIGGAEIAVHNIALQQYQAGHQVVVISTWKSWRAVASVVPYRVLPLIPRTTTWVLDSKRRGYDMRWLVGKQLEFYQRFLGFDVWHVHVAYYAGLVAKPVLNRMQLPCVVTCQGADIQTLPETGYGLRLDPVIEGEIVETLHAFDRVVAISRSMHAEFLQLGIAPERIRDIPNGVEAYRIKTLQVDRGAVRSELGWPLEKFVLLTVGRNHPKKGYRFIPEIIKQVRETRRDFLWVIVGRNAEPIAEMAQELGVDECLEVVSQIEGSTTGGIKTKTDSRMFSLPTDELIHIYKSADAFVFPSLLEGLPLVLVEAMAAGLPVITTDAPGCRDVVEHGVTGLISPVKDTSSMAKNILRLLADPSLLSEMGRNGELRSAEYEWRNVASQYCSVYEGLVKESHSNSTILG